MFRNGRNVLFCGAAFMHASGMREMEWLRVGRKRDRPLFCCTRAICGHHRVGQVLKTYWPYVYSGLSKDAGAPSTAVPAEGKRIRIAFGTSMKNDGGRSQSSLARAVSHRPVSSHGRKVSRFVFVPLRSPDTLILGFCSSLLVALSQDLSLAVDTMACSSASAPRRV